MTIFVCGASGYVGTNLLKAYPECVPVPRMGLPDARAGDTVINLAAYGLHPHQTDIVTMVGVNTLYPIRLYESLSNGARMIHCCSYSERHVPDYQYCRTKSIATKHLAGKATLAWVHTPFGGINSPPHKFMTVLLNVAKDGGEFRCVHAMATRDLIHVRHVCDGLMKLAKVDVGLMEADLGSGDMQVQSHVVNMVKAISKMDIKIINDFAKGGDMLFQSRNPYIKCNFMEDLKMEVSG
jgi:hypothetical protein